MALWDLLGRSLGVPVVDLWGGPCRADMALYASGGWADADGIGAELGTYVAAGFGAVKMRVGVIDGTVDASVARVGAARQALGPTIELMVDAHGTFSVAEAKRFAAGVEPLDVRWFEEPVSADDRRGLAEVRASTHVAIAAGESEFNRFDFRDLIEHQAVDVVQPDLAICGGPTEGAAHRLPRRGPPTRTRPPLLGFGIVVLGRREPRLRQPGGHRDRILARSQPAASRSRRRARHRRE